MEQLSYLQNPPKLGFLPAHDHPMRRVSEAPQACNYTELLAALIGSQRQLEIAEKLLTTFGSLGAIRRASVREIQQVQGIGECTAVRVISALELGSRLVSETGEEFPTIHSPGDAAALIQYEMSCLEQEELWILLLNTRNRMIDIDKLYRGSLNSSQARIGELFKSAIRRNAAAIIMAHCHPSGDPTPSPDDVAITRATVEAGRLLDVDVLDHLVIGKGRWVSMKERRLGF